MLRKRKYTSVKRTKKENATGKKVTVSERPPVREQIESWPKIRTHEMMWGKQIGEVLTSLAKQNARRRTGVIPELLKKGEKYNFIIHTHPFTLVGLLRRRGQAIPSKSDVIRFLERYKRGETESEVIVSLSPSGKVKGYTIVSLKGVRKPKEQIEKELKQFFSSKGPFYKLEWIPGGVRIRDISPIKNLELIKIYLDGLKKIGFRFRYVPMPGYYFDGKTAEFKRKRRK